MPEEVDRNRRFMFAGSLAAVAAGGAGWSAAQDWDLPSLDDTLAYLKTPPMMRLLYTQFSLAFTLGVNIVVLREVADLDNLKKLETLPLLPVERPEIGEVFSLLQDLSGQKGMALRNTTYQTMAEKGDPLEGIREAHDRFVNSFAKAVNKAGLSADPVIVANAINSLTHVERIVVINLPVDNGDSYFCRIFPFKWFCS